MKPSDCPERIWLTYSEDHSGRDDEEQPPTDDVYWRGDTDQPELDVAYIRADVAEAAAQERFTRAEAERIAWASVYARASNLGSTPAAIDLYLHGADASMQSTSAHIEHGHKLNAIIARVLADRAGNAEPKPEATGNGNADTGKENPV